jgi:hypothetical protein
MRVRWYVTNCCYVVVLILLARVVADAAILLIMARVLADVGRAISLFSKHACNQSIIECVFFLFGHGLCIFILVIHVLKV